MDFNAHKFIQLLGDLEDGDFGRTNYHDKSAEYAEGWDDARSHILREFKNKLKDPAKKLENAVKHVNRIISDPDELQRIAEENPDVNQAVTVAALMLIMGEE